MNGWSNLLTVAIYLDTSTHRFGAAWFPVGTNAMHDGFLPIDQ
jgi:hypothetical protein